MKEPKKIEDMTRRQRAEYLLSGKLKVDRITQYLDGQFISYYVARCRGFVLSIDDFWKFNTPEAARAYGEKCFDVYQRIIEQEAYQQ